MLGKTRADSCVAPEVDPVARKSIGGGCSAPIAYHCSETFYAGPAQLL
jgi:hypothetical protein